MITIILPAIASALCLAIGFILGRCFRDFESMALLQEYNAAASENDALRESLADARSRMNAMQSDIDTLAARYQEHKDVA
jgi:hypothetical protein